MERCCGGCGTHQEVTAIKWATNKPDKRSNPDYIDYQVLVCIKTYKGHNIRDLYKRIRTDMLGPWTPLRFMASIERLSKKGRIQNQEGRLFPR